MLAVQKLAQAVRSYIQKYELLKPGDRVGVAVSGGADSVALLRVLVELRKELGVTLAVAHFNHQLRGADADADEQFVQELARGLRLEFLPDRGDVAGYAADHRLSIEAAARELRLQYFTRLLRAGPLNKIATAHTLDDQAETVLLRVARGTGTRGLAGIYPRLPVSQSGVADRNPDGKAARFIVRPLLGTRRSQLEEYLAELGQEWREDKSIRDLRHARNRVRHGILPRLERNLNPSVRETLAELAEVARAEEDYWADEVARVLPQAMPAPGILKAGVLAGLPLAMQRRVVRAAATVLRLTLEFRHVEEVLSLLTKGAGAANSTMLPDGWVVSRHKADLRFERAHKRPEPSDYEYCLPVPGWVEVRELGSRFEAVLVPRKGTQGYNPEQLVELELAKEDLRVRNWRAGDRFWPAHSKSPKKIKELLQKQHVSGPERKRWPVVSSGTTVVWLRGFPGRGGLRETEEAVWIREIALESGRPNP